MTNEERNLHNKAHFITVAAQFNPIMLDVYRQVWGKEAYDKAYRMANPKGIL